ncbi:hypothetical protein [Lysobacter enzymogenes]|uniref:hypothetical protein n=1 Tax=Lysobacter enzymogenes TaxID=69 RepID=UPI002264CAC4|nr:hypothetical protein [Lysobacter enzymogenes]UZW61866.1 hypothetical protein BV903_006070 [Lysobacter enzymogenes]
MEISLPIVSAFLGGVAASYIKYHAHMDSQRKSARDRLGRLYDLTSEKLDEVPALALQIAVLDAFGRSIDEAWIKLIVKQRNPLPLLQDCARTSHLLQLSEDGTKIVDRTKWNGKHYSSWSWLAIFLGAMILPYALFFLGLSLITTP